MSSQTMVLTLERLLRKLLELAGDGEKIIDQSCRRFSPVPRRIQDGGEDVEHIPAAVLSGAPHELQGRTVRYGGHCYCGRSSSIDLCHTESINQQKLQHNLVTGMVTTGEWTGISFPRATDGKIR